MWYKKQRKSDTTGILKMWMFYWKQKGLSADNNKNKRLNIYTYNSSQNSALETNKGKPRSMTLVSTKKNPILRDFCLVRMPGMPSVALASPTLTCWPFLTRLITSIVVMSFACYNTLLREKLRVKKHRKGKIVTWDNTFRGKYCCLLMELIIRRGLCICGVY